MEINEWVEKFKQLSDQDLLRKMVDLKETPGITRSRINCQAALQEELISRGFHSIP